MTRRSLLGICLIVGGCSKPAPPAPTVATVEVARPGTNLIRGGETIPLASARRVEAGAELRTPATSRASLRLDGGSWALLDADSALRVDDNKLTLLKGRAWIDARDVDALTVAVPGGTLTASAAGFAVALDGGGARAYCVAGQLTWATAGGGDRLEAGMSVRIAGDGKTRVEPEAQWDDWTGGLAEPGPPRALDPAGVGVLAARAASEVGAARTPLITRKHDVRARIDRDRVTVEVEQVFFNPRSEEVEGVYTVRLPRGALLAGFSVGDTQPSSSWSSLDDWGALTVAAASRDGSGAGGALEWAGANAYRARLASIAPGKTATVKLRWVEWLARQGGRRSWTYPMGGGQPPLLGEFSLEVDAAAAAAGALEPGMGARVEGSKVVLRRSDFRPRADFALDLLDPPNPPPKVPLYRAQGPDAPGYLLVAGEPPVGKPPASLDLVLVVDTSAATDPTRLDLERAVVDAILRQLGGNDRVAVMAASVDARPLGQGEPLQPATAKRAEQLLDALARAPAAGATDLAHSLEQAAALLPAGGGALVYIGDGRPTVGALAPAEVVDHLGRVGQPPRLFAVGVGADARMDLLQALAGDGGTVAVVEDRPQAAHAAYRVLAAAALPTLRDLTFDLGPSVDVLYPSQPITLAAGEPLRVVARLRTATAPTKLTLRGLRDGKPFTDEVALAAQAIDDAGDLRRRWAAGRLDDLLRRGAGREAVAEVGTRFGLVTPWSALVAGGGAYVPAFPPEESGTYVPPALRGAAPDDAPIALPDGLTSTPSGASSLPALYARAIGEHDEAVRVCYDRKAAGHPELSGRVEVKVKIGLAGEVQAANILSSTVRNHEVEACMLRAVQALRLPPPPDGKVQEIVRAWQFEAEDGRVGAQTRCSAASRQYLAARRALWRERLAGNPGVEGAMAVWRQADRACELKTWLDRRALLELMRPSAGTTLYQVDLYHRFDGETDVQGFLRREILRGARTAEDVQAIRGGLALDGGIAPELLAAQLKKASDVAARIRVVRQFLALAPDGVALRLKLLALLEEAHQLDEAARVAWSLRADPASDARARQAVGEFFARRGDGDEAARAFSEIVEFAPFDPWARRRLGDLYRAHARFEDAYREYATLAWLTPNDPSVLLLLAQAAAGAGRIDEALRLQERLGEATAAGGAGASDVPSFARTWTSVRLAGLRADARKRNDRALLARLAARGRSDGVLAWSGELLVALTWAHPDAQLQLWSTLPGDAAAKRAPVRGGGVGVEALRLARVGGRPLRLAIRRPTSGDPARYDGELWLLWNEGSDDEHLERVPIHFGANVAEITLDVHDRTVTLGREVAAAR